MEIKKLQSFFKLILTILTLLSMQYMYFHGIFKNEIIYLKKYSFDIKNLLLIKP